MFSTRTVSFTVLFLVGSVTAVEAAGWRVDYNRAMAEAKRTNKPVVLHFHASWCGPCRIMDATVLHTGQVQQALNSQIIGVKVDVDQNKPLAQRYGVSLLPSDVFISPDGKVLKMTTGKHSLGGYTGMMNQVAMSYARSNPRRIPEPERFEPKPQPEEKPVIVEKTEPGDDHVIGLKGYSPVALSRDREWWRGDAKFAHAFKGVTYYLRDATELAMFQEAPHQYAPRLLGCDPVELYNTDRALTGNIEYGAFYDGELYLFSTENSRKKFKEAPYRYVRTRHVLRVDLIGGSVLR